jgi:ATP-dependent RNA helicase DHX29
MAKKKKPAVNPARGFATTSVASKTKLEKPVIEATLHKVDTEAATSAAEKSQASVNVTTPPKVALPTAEELEAQLNRDELQLLVEKYAVKVRRDSQRHVSKFQTDRRVLRTQAEFMAVHDWLPTEVMDTIISLAQNESNDSNRRPGQQSLLKVLSEEEAMAKLWTLDLTLHELGFTPDNIKLVLKWLCANASSIDTAASIWGFQEALEWLALNNCEGHSFSYDEPQTKLLATDSPSISRPSTPVSDASPFSAATVNDSDGAQATTNPDVNVSDLESDIEPDQLVPTYIKIKARLFELDPDALEIKHSKLAKAPKVRKGQPRKPINGAAVRKLQSQLQQLESDALFDEKEAEALWPAKRNQIAQAMAAEKRSPGSGLTAGDDRNMSEHSGSLHAHNINAQAEAGNDPLDDDEPDMLGDMFTALPDESSIVSSKGSDIQEHVVLRDFGKQGGLSPRRLLEEAIRSRDPGARIAFNLVSPTTYSCRHNLTINWTKPQDIDYDQDITGVTCDLQPSRASFTATTVATVSTDQSESYISTSALFSLCVASSKDEKIHLRLPPTWRDHYRDMLERRKNRIDEQDRNTISQLRSLIQDQLENEESDGIVLTSRFKMRNQATASSTTSNSGKHTPQPANETLVDLWRQKSATALYQEMLRGRMNLPVFGFRSSILSTIDQHQVTIICGETGCGKSTQIPAYILEHELSQGKSCKIYCTEPRRISAISLAQRVSEELGEGRNDLGTFRSVVGYAIRLESKITSQTRLVYATVGVVLRMLETSSRLDEVTHLMIDEVHERR